MLPKTALYLLSILLLVACSTQGASVNVPNTIQLTGCTDPRPEVCTSEYRPVCGIRDTAIRCVKAPCPTNEYRVFPNACEACRDQQVFGHAESSCEDLEERGPQFKE
jgi:hypothetical protein